MEPLTKGRIWDQVNYPFKGKKNWQGLGGGGGAEVEAELQLHVGTMWLGS